MWYKCGRGQKPGTGHSAEMPSFGHFHRVSAEDGATYTQIAPLRYTYICLALIFMCCILKCIGFVKIMADTLYLVSDPAKAQPQVELIAGTAGVGAILVIVVIIIAVVCVR